MASYVVDWVQWIDSVGIENNTSLLLDASRNIYTTGYTNGASTSVTLSGVNYPRPNGATAAGYMFKLNTNGEYQNLIWVDGTGSETCELSVLDLSQSLIICGSCLTGSASFTVSGNVITKRFGSTGVGYVSKFNSTGAYQWTQLVDGSGNETNYKCITDNSNNIFVAGSTTGSTQINISGLYYTKPLTSITTNNSCYITRLGSTSIPFGTVQWVDSSGTVNRPNGIATDSSNNIYVGVTIQSCPTQVYINSILQTRPSFSTTTNIGVIVKYNQNLVYQWHQFIDTSGAGTSALINDINIDSSNNLYVYGNTSSSLLNISGVFYNITRPSSNTGFLIKYNTNGGYLWHQYIDGNGVQSISALTYDLCKNIVITCYNNTSSDVAPFLIYISGIAYNTGTRYSTINTRYSPNGVFDNFVNIYQTDSILDSNNANSITDTSGNLYITQNAATFTISGITYNSPFIASASTAQSLIKYKALYIPIAPTGLNIFNSFPQGFDLSWNNATYATSYRVAYGISGYYDMSAVFSGLSGTISGLIPGFQYNIVVAGISPDGQGSYSSPIYAIPQYPSPVNLSGIISSLLPGNWYNYQIVGINPVSESLRSTTLYSIPISQAPTGLTATPRTLAMLMSWNSISGTLYYKIYYGLSGVYDLSASFSGDLTVSGIISSLTNDVWYNFKISAVNGGGESPLSTEVYGMPVSIPPLTPTGLSSTPQIRAIELNWNVSSGANGYNIYYGLSGVYDLSATYTGLSGTVSGLSGDYYYNFKISAYSDSGESALSSAVYGLPLMPTPSGLTAISQIQAVDLSWNSISEAVNYEVLYGLSGSFDLSAAFSGISGTISSLSAGSFYNFKVAAIGGQGTLTAYSSVVYRIPISPTPTGLTATSGSGSIIVSWNSSPGTTLYKVYYGLSGVYDTSATFMDLSTNIGGLTAGSWYNFKVSTINGGGESPLSSAVYAMPYPLTPTGLNVLPLVEGANIFWNDSIGATYYTIYYGLSGSYDISESVIPSFHTISGLIGNSVYNVKVTASNDAGTSDYSGPVYFTAIPGIPDIPTGLILTPTICGIDASWNPVFTAEYYVIEYDVSGLFTITNVIYDTTLSVSGLIPGTWYNFRVSAGNITGDSSFCTPVFSQPLYPVPLTPANLGALTAPEAVDLSWNSTLYTTSYTILYGLSGSYDLSASFSGLSGTISSLTAGVWYNFKVGAIGPGGESAFSAAVYAAPLSLAPTGLVGVSAVQAANLTWNASSGATSYTVYYGISGSFDLSASFSGISGTIIGLSPGSWYNFKVVAVGLGGESAASSIVYVSPLTLAPTGLNATPKVEAIDLSWNIVSGANSYKLYYGLIGVYDLSASFSGISGTISGLLANTFYNFKVTAISLGGESAFSNSVSEAPLSNAPTGLTVTSKVQAADLSWNTISGSTGYVIYYGLSGVYDLSATFSSISGTISSLTAGSWYNFKVSSFGPGGESPQSSPVYTIPLSPTPTSLTVSSLVTAAYLTWNASSGATTYKIYYGLSGALDLYAYFNGVSGIIDGILPGSWYNFAIVAVNGGGESPISSFVYTIPIAETPTGFTATGAINAVDLSWNISFGSNSYTVYYGISGVLDLSASFTGLSGSIGGLTVGTWYNFSIAAVNDGGQSPTSAIIYGIPLPDVPTGLTITPNVGAVIANWISASGATGYKVYYGLSGDYSLIDPFSGSSTISGYIDVLTPGLVYNFVISSVGPGGESAVSSPPVYAIPLSQTPTGLVAVSAVEAADLSWNVSLGADSYTVYYGLSGFLDLSASFTSLSGNVGGLTAGSWYNFAIAAVNGGGQSPISDVVYAVPISQTPTGLVTTAKVQAIDLSWNVSPGADNYIIYYGLSGALDLSASFSGISGTISSLSAGTWYNFAIVAVNLGGVSPISSLVYGAPLSLAPTGLTISGQIEAADLSWNASVGAVSYKVYYGLSGFLDLSASFAGLSGSIAGLTAGVWYNFAVVAVGPAGGESPYSSLVYVIPISPIPTGFASTTGSESVTLSWNTSSGATSYKVIYGLSGVYDLSASFTGLSGYLGGLTAGSWYNFKIAAVNGGGQSPYSAAIYDNPITAIPTGLTATSLVESALLSWNIVTGATSYKVYYGLSGFYNLNTTFSGGSTISGIISSLTGGSWYNFVISSIGPGGESGLSSPVYAMPISLAPTGLTAYPLNLAVNLTWNTVSGTSYYTVYYGVSGTYTNIAVTTTPNKNISGLTYGFTYNFKVTATNLGGESPFSGAVYMAPLPAIPATPIGLTASGISSGIYLDWSASSGADYYKIYYGLSGSFATIYTISGGSTISGIISPLTPAVVYNFKILAGNTGGESALSSAVFGTPLYNPVSTPSGFTVVPNYGSVDMSWNSVTDAMYYLVYYGLDGITFGSSAYFTSSPGSITGLSGGVTYYFYIVAANPDFVSASGGVVTATPTIQPPDTPVLLSAIPGVVSVTLNWSAAARADNYYVVYGIYGIFDMSMNFPGTGTTGTISGLTAILYNFAVVATNAGGESAQSNVLTATPFPFGPAIIPSYIIQPIIPGHIDLVLNIYQSPDADLYRIYYGEASGNFDYFIDTFDTTDILISYLTPDTLYNIKVRTYSGPSYVDSVVVYIRTLAEPSQRTLYSNTNASSVTTRNESNTVYIYKQQYDLTGDIWTFRSDRERMLYLEGLRRNRAEK